LRWEMTDGRSLRTVCSCASNDAVDHSTRGRGAEVDLVYLWQVRTYCCGYGTGVGVYYEHPDLSQRGQPRSLAEGDWARTGGEMQLLLAIVIVICLFCHSVRNAGGMGS
jgi:hypothetical protein